MARLGEAMRFSSHEHDVDPSTLASQAKAVISALARQATAGAGGGYGIAGALREVWPREGAATRLTGRRYEAEGTLRTVGETIRRNPVSAILLTAGVGYLATRARRRAGNGVWRAGRRTLTEVMTRDVEVVHPESSIRDAAARMAARDIGIMPVCDGDKLVGLVTDRDIVVRGIARGADPASTPVRDVMTSSPSYSFDDEPLDRAIHAMKSRKIRRLPILDRQRRLVGIVSLRDLAVDHHVVKASEALP